MAQSCGILMSASEQGLSTSPARKVIPYAMALERQRAVIVVKYHQPLPIPISQCILNLKADSVFIVKIIGLIFEYLLCDDFITLYD